MMERVPSGQEVPTEDNGGSEDTLTSSLLYIEQVSFNLVLLVFITL